MRAENSMAQDWRSVHTLACGSWSAWARREQLDLELGNGAGGAIPRRWGLPTPPLGPCPDDQVQFPVSTTVGQYLPFPSFDNTGGFLPWEPSRGQEDNPLLTLKRVSLGVTSNGRQAPGPSLQVAATPP